MINFLIRILSFVICIALLAGGVYLTVTTSDFEGIEADINELMDNEKTPWIAGIEASQPESEQNPEGDPVTE